MAINRYKQLMFGFGPRAVWPFYLVLIAYASRQAPWPRDIALFVSAVVGFGALAWLATNFARWFFGDGGPAETDFQLRPDVAKQCRIASMGLIGGLATFLLPAYLLSNGWIATGGRPLIAPMAVRVLILAFELNLLLYAVWVTRKRSAVVCWMSEHADQFGWLIRRRRLVAVLVLSSMGAIILLDLLGYSFSARRLASGGWQTFLVAFACLLLYRFMVRSIDRHAWRWVRLGNSLTRHQQLQDHATTPEDLAMKLRRMVKILVPVFGVFMLSYVWDVDLALFRFLGKQQLWAMDAGKTTYVTVGDLTKAIVVFTVTAAAWRHMSTFFVLVVFPRMPDDPGIRFAMITLCRYAVLGIGLLSGLSAIHLGLEKIGVVLAALGVGLGFGLQEIVSNFICGIILLLERPIRVGDIVTVAGTTGKVDRINIRATSIINGDNQSMIVPNRAFITGDLVNWTLKDKVIRVTVRVRVAPGTDPEKVADVLLAIAREDTDIVVNPVPVALLEDFSESALVFVLHSHVPEPALAGRVKHRLFSKIQKRFAEVGIEIPLPGHELRFRGIDDDFRSLVVSTVPKRVDPPSVFPGPHSTPNVAAPAPLEDCHRGVDE